MSFGLLNCLSVLYLDLLLYILLLHTVPVCLVSSLLSLSGWVAAADLSQDVEDGVVKMEDAFKCLYCEYSGKTRQHVTNHIEARHMSGLSSYTCDICFKVCPTKNSFNVHKSRVHNKPRN